MSSYPDEICTSNSSPSAPTLFVLANKRENIGRRVGGTHTRKTKKEVEKERNIKKQSLAQGRDPATYATLPRKYSVCNMDLNPFRCFYHITKGYELQHRTILIVYQSTSNVVSGICRFYGHTAHRYRLQK
jgi:hypothetical protein